MYRGLPTTKAERRHPMLVQAGVDDDELEMDFAEFMVGMVSAPDLTFQYSPLGELNTSSFYTHTPLCEDAPTVYRARFIKHWTVLPEEPGDREYNGEVCWERLRELVGQSLQRLPDNPFVLEDAWLVSLVDEVPARFRSMLDRLHGRIEKRREVKGKDADAETLARTTGEPQVLRTYVTDRCCNGNANECSFDQATEYVLPDGSRQTKFTCCF